MGGVGIAVLEKDSGAQLRTKNQRGEFPLIR